MTMTNEEICRSFRQAMQPRKQIGILAELNQCDRSRIVEILREGGETLPAPYKQDKPAAAGATGHDDYREADYDPLPAADPEKQKEIIREEQSGDAIPGTVTVPAEEVEKGRIARAAVGAIDKLMLDYDGFYGEGSGDAFAEQVRGVLAMAKALLGEETE